MAKIQENIRIAQETAKLAQEQRAADIKAGQPQQFQPRTSISIGNLSGTPGGQRQADEFNRQSDLFICLGYSWGAMKEIACAQYFNKKKIYILKEFISEELPKELSFLVEYISIKDIRNKVNEIK